MLSSALFVFVASMSSLAAVNGAVFQRDGTFTFLTPQPTSPSHGAPSTTTTTSPSTTVTPPMNSTTPCTTITTSSTTMVVPPTTSTTPCNTTTSSSTTVIVPPTTSSAPCTTSTTSSTAVVPPCTVSCITPVVTSTTPCSTPPPPPTTPCTTSTFPVVTSCTKAQCTSTPISSGSVNCNGIQQWQASFAYTMGNQVIFNNQLFTAQQWTFNNEPPTHPDQWAPGGTCAQPINNQANCNGVAAWQSNVAYTAGNKATFNNHLWSAVQWTQSNAPGDTSGSWKDLGACA